MLKEDFKKITDYLWEIPQDLHKEMRVPARIYASEKILEECLKDESLEQLINTATLPGVVKYTLAMPDIHEGYGFPIGGVAATKLEDGVISPGGVGFDINCLPSNSLISSVLGYYLPIKFLNDRRDNLELALLNKKSKKLITAKIINFFSRKENNYIYSVKTKSGFLIKATGDHPIYTAEGLMKKIETIKLGDKVILHPFKGVLYEEPKNLQLIDEEKVIKAFLELNLDNSGSRKSQIVKWFKKTGFIDLNLRSWQTPYLIKIIGYLFGDGTVNLIGKRRKGQISFYGTFKDLNQIKADLERIGIKSNLSSRSRIHKFTNFYGKTYTFSTVEHCLKISSTGFALLLYLLGVPFGNKVYQEYRIPSWLNKSSLWQKRLFLAAFFGAEMSKPATINKFNFRAPTLNINKTIPLKSNGIFFLNEIKNFLSELKIDSTEVVEVEGLANIGKTVGLRFQIASNSENIKKFFETIGFEYHIEKQKLAGLALMYLKQKEQILNLRQRIRNLARNFYQEGIPAAVLVNQYKGEFVNKRFVEHSIWSKREKPRIAYNFVSFDEFVKSHSYGESGFAIDEIEEISKEEYHGLVYDLTINDINHNFIADNFVVSNCGMRLLKSNYNVEEIKNYLDDLATEIQKEVPSGLGQAGQFKFNIRDLDKILEGGSRKLVEDGYGEKEDLENCESNGVLKMADTLTVSDLAKERGRDQLGTLGSGNHFLEIQKVEEIFDEETAKIFGLFENQVVVMIHTGSRGLGHQIATDYIKIMLRGMPKYNINLPDRELAACPLNSSEGKRYLEAMSCGANYAWANRQMISYFVRKSWKKVLGFSKNSDLIPVYDVAHNIAKIEEHEINGEKINLCVHRKGATRAFPGQPVLIPGSMGTASYVLIGTEKAKEAFYSTSHGAGRTMSRHQAIKNLSAPEIVKNLEKQGIIVKCWSFKGIAEEAPQAYKNIDEVIEVAHQSGLSKKVAKLKPLAVIKGE